jgi:hypothetical protein
MKVKKVYGTETIDVVRVHKPRNGGSRLLGEFLDRDGKGDERADDYIAKKGHDLVD